mgnify:CR=1 FL=1
MTHSFEEAIAACVGGVETAEAEDGCLQVRATARFPESFVGFAGHFPKAPVLPAIVQLAAVRLLVEQTVQQHLEGERFSRTKFRGMVGPAEDIFFQLKIDGTSDGWQGKFKITSEAMTTISSGSFAFTTVSA